MLRPIGLKLVPVVSSAGEVGMETCLRNLRSRGFVPSRVLDVGAGRGAWTELAMTCWPDSRYFLIEPLQERLVSLCALSHRNPNVTFLLLGAGSEVGERAIGVMEDFLDGSSLVYEGSAARSVRVETIDHLLEEARIEQPDFMKIDVQGYELEVLKGAQRCLDRCSLVLTEVEFFRFAPAMPLLHEIVAWMVAHGYRPYEVADILRRPSDRAMGQCDLLFCREGHWLLRSDTW
jgi:FkbM family methyltransferase